MLADFIFSQFESPYGIALACVCFLVGFLFVAVLTGLICERQQLDEPSSDELRHHACRHDAQRAAFTESRGDVIERVRRQGPARRELEYAGLDEDEEAFWREMNRDFHVGG